MKSIILTNVGGLKKASLDLAPVTFLVGQNGTGKTSFVKGMTSLLTKETGDDFIHKGEKDACVFGLLEDGTSIELNKTGKTVKHNSCGKKITKSAAEEIIQKSEHLSGDAISALLATNQGLLDMKKEAFLDVMASAIINNVDRSKLYDKMGLSDEEKGILLSISLKPTLSKDDLEEIFKALSAKTTDARKKITLLQGEISALQAQTPQRKKPVVEKDVETWKGFFAEAKNYQESLNKSEESKKRYAAYMQRLQQLQQDIKSRQVPKPDENALIGVRRKLSDVEKDIGFLQKDIEVSEASRNNLEKVLKELNTNICPISKNLVCMTDKSTVKAEVKANIASMDAMIESMKTRLEAGMNKIKTLKTAETKLVEEDRNYRAYAALLENYRKLDAQKPVVLQPPMPVAHSLDECNTRLAKLNQELAQIELWEKGEEKKKDLKKLNEETDTVYNLRLKFSPKGLVYDVLGKMAESLLNQFIAEEANNLGIKDKYTFEFNEGLLLHVDHNGAQMEASALSCGERFLTQLLLISVINRVTQFGYCVIDNIDALDRDNLRKVIDFVRNPAFKKRFRNVVFSGVAHEDTMTELNALNDPDVKVYNFTPNGII